MVVDEVLNFHLIYVIHGIYTAPVLHEQLKFLHKFRLHNAVYLPIRCIAKSGVDTRSRILFFHKSEKFTPSYSGDHQMIKDGH